MSRWKGAAARYYGLLARPLAQRITGLAVFSALTGASALAALFLGILLAG